MIQERIGMPQLKKLLLLSSALLLTACAVKFDPVEHNHIVDVRLRVYDAQQNQLCNEFNTAKYTAEALDSDATRLVFYSQYIANNDLTEKMATELKKTTGEFANRYRNLPVPTKGYCELKLKNIATQVEVIQRANARRPR